MTVKIGDRIPEATLSSLTTLHLVALLFVT